MSKLVRIVPFDRLNAILVVSSQPHYLKEVKTWIDRLDVDQTPSERKLWVYQIQNGRAADLSHTLQRLLLGQETKSEATAKTDIASQMPVMPFSSNNGASAPPNTRLPAVDQVSAGLNPNDPSSQGLRIIADDTTNSLVIWANKAEFALIQDAMKKLDIVPMQVRIEAVIAEVTLTDDLRYGVQYLFQGKHGGSVLTNASAVSVASTVPGFSAFVTGSNINAILDLLQSVTTVHVISSPQLMVLNNQTAVIQVGDQVPISTQSAVSTVTAGAPVVNSIEMKDTGVIMKVTPRVNASGMVLMDISQEVSDVTTTTTSQIDSPTIQERKIASSVAVRDGETIALGGMIKDSVTDDKNGIPLLEDIPYAGNLFSYTTKDRTRTELIALITPRVVRNDNDVRQVTDEMRQQMSAVTPLNAQIHH
jgi:general secretion pathway protein D